MRPHSLDDVLESVLDTCRTRVDFSGDPLNRTCHQKSAGDAEREQPQGHFYLMTAGANLATGPTLQDQVELSGGDLAIVFSSVRHEIAAIDTDHAARSLECAAMLSGRFDFPMGEDSPLLYALPGCLILRANEAGKGFRELMEMLLDLTRESQPVQQMVVNKLAGGLITFAICEYAYKSPTPRGIFAAIMDERMARVLQAIHCRAGDDWNINSLAALAGMSRSTFAQHFSSHMGVSPMRYLSSWRVAQAKRLLQDRRLSVAKVAEMLGYSSEAAFRKFFKRVEGVGPGRARAARTVRIPAATACERDQRS